MYREDVTVGNNRDVSIYVCGGGGGRVEEEGNEKYAGVRKSRIVCRLYSKLRVVILLIDRCVSLDDFIYVLLLADFL